MVGSPGGHDVGVTAIKIGVVAVLQDPGGAYGGSAFF